MIDCFEDANDFAALSVHRHRDERTGFELECLIHLAIDTLFVVRVGIPNRRLSRTQYFTNNACAIVHLQCFAFDSQGGATDKFSASSIP